ncbi:N-acetylglucosamine-6-phosphate deacetylase [Mycoplasma todarodis]|uniref:N-acetylglucosamine-6-phosphate deacetylase n=1 Tax=Mycoplasma todarodis TaxID=1937191 RepID=A0A4R0XPN3_9MOLU|nr:N-acetylglucosamine-6-phosphate deacetylase [Mycoplasma todarodis]TCG11502.1 N-acetylglucosamine-6-phosphate deacetylase [Mycoplasma todarodis]
MLLKNVKIVNYNSTIKNADIEIENGLIKKIIKKEGEAEQVVVPGFINTHVHGCMGDDAMDSKEAVERISANLVKFGTTTYLSTLMTAEVETIIEAFKFNAEAESKGAKIAGFHIEGPWISMAKKGAHRPECLHSPTVEELKAYQEAAQGGIKKITYAPEECPEGFTEEMVKLGIMPTIGHTNATFEQTMEAIEAGGHTCTHLWNAMSGVANRNPGAVEAIIFNEKNMPELITDLVHVDEATVRFTIKTVGVDRVVVITDAIRPAGLPDGESMSGGIPIVKKGAVIKLKGTDTIAGSASTMHYQFMNLVKMGYELEDIVKMTSHNAAVNLKWDKEIGQISEGFKADIVVMDKETFDIKSVYVDGENKI